VKSNGSATVVALQFMGEGCRKVLFETGFKGLGYQ